jgi:hypothetical protein
MARVEQAETVPDNVRPSAGCARSERLEARSDSGAVSEVVGGEGGAETTGGSRLPGRAVTVEPECRMRVRVTQSNQRGAERERARPYAENNCVSDYSETWCSTVAADNAVTIRALISASTSRSILTGIGSISMSLPRSKREKCSHKTGVPLEIMKMNRWRSDSRRETNFRVAIADDGAAVASATLQPSPSSTLSGIAC